MADAVAFPASQTEYAFPPAPGEEDDAVQSDQRNQQIQSAFDANRFQRGLAQNLSKALSSEAGQIAELRERQAQQKSSS